MTTEWNNVNPLSLTNKQRNARKKSPCEPTLAIIIRHNIKDIKIRFIQESNIIILRAQRLKLNIPIATKIQMQLNNNTG